MNLPLVLVLWVAIAWGMFALFAALSELYDRASWRLPTGAEEANLPRRLRVGILLGAGACVACVATVVVQTDRPLLIFSLVVQGALMAAAGVTDLHKYRLPLPLTLGGIAMALAVAVLAATPIEMLMLGAVWSCALIIVHMRMSHGAMGWGDHLAVLWIGIAAPLVGVFAILAGHCATLVCTKLTGWGRRPVPIGGAWLLAGAMLVALPGGVKNSALVMHPQAASRAAAIEIRPAGRELAQSGRMRILHTVLREAGFHTAKVAFGMGRAGREQAAQAAAVHVMDLARLAHGAETVDDQRASRLLNDLARALERYDLAGVDALSQQRAELLNELFAGLEPHAHVGRDVTWQ